ncbi:helix-turn-helix transcriptional regulator [Salinibius halmophilus]|uniref:helix-turn-helix transcriptional regulator n=1 Tax=Salinibius halmophilus TaxID=1853216 RepID=UPI000E6605D9|nr:AraC family transcriptional regulator [Salinibius halmophilus]
MSVDICQKGSGTEELIIDCDDLPPLIEQGILQVGKARAQVGYRMYRRQPKFHMILFTNSGEGRLTCTQGEICLQTDSMVFIPAGLENEFIVSQAPWHFSWLMLTPEAHWKSIHRTTAWHQPTRYTNLVDHAVEGIYQTAKHVDDRKLLRLIAKQLTHICDLSLQTEHAIPAAQLRLQRLFDYVDQRLEQNWNLERMAEQVHYSVPHLVRQCRQWLQISPNKKLIQLRMGRACSLLTTTNTPISQIALAVGYDEPANFSAAFKLHTGLTPSSYRSRHHQSLPN